MTESSLNNAISELSSLQEKLNTEKDDEKKKSIESSINSVESSISNYSKSIDDYNKRIPELKEDIVIKKGWKDMTFSGKGLDTLQSEYGTYYFSDATLRDFSRITHGMNQVINKSSTLSYKMADRTFTNKAQLVEGGFANAEILSERSKEMASMYEQLTQGFDFLENARDGLIFVSDQLSKDGGLITKQAAWSEKSSDGDIKGTTVSEQNLSEIDSVKEFINKEEVDQLLAHLQGAYDTLAKAKTEIETYRYGDTMIKDTASMENAVKALKDKGFGSTIENARAAITELDALDEDVFKTMYQEPVGGFTHTWSDNNQNPELEKGNHSFYGYLKQLFDKVVDENSGEEGGYKSKKKEAEKTKEETDSKLESYKEVKDENPDGTTTGETKADKFTYSGKNLPSYQWKNGLKDELITHNEAAEADYEKAEMSSGDMKSIEGEGEKAGSSITAFFAELGTAVKDLGLDLRDNLFISGYIMSMFSYDTFENEKIWKANGSSTLFSDNIINRKNIEVNDRSYVTACYNEDGSFHNTEAEKLTALDLTSLTRVPISPSNNAAYLREIEYIVYNTDNANAAYGTIYAIRSGFNIVYAFSDTEISTMAQGIATAIFGTPPLTFLVPIAKIAIIIGVALAESALDILCLKSGMAIPIYKTKETWMLSVRNLINGAADTVKAMAAEKLKETADSMIGFGTNQLNDWLNMADEEMKELAAKGSFEAEQKVIQLGDAVSDSLTKAVEQYIGTALDQVITLCDETKTMIRDGAPLSDDERIAYIEEKLVAWLSQDVGDKDNIMYKAKDKAVEFLIDNGYITQIMDELKKLEEAGISAIEGEIDKVGDELESTKNAIIESFDEYLDGLVRTLSREIVQAEGEIKDYIDKAKEEAAKALEEGSDALKATVSESIDGLLGSTGGKGDKSFINTNVTASLYSFQYSDYLQIFLLIALMANQEGVILRMADVIQTNTGLVKNGAAQLSELDSDKPNGYQLKKSYTYVELEATIEVKPLFMTLPFVVSESPEEITKNRNWYTIKYRGVQGY